ncbi:endonuclease V [Vibrio alginolyticus]|nr:endonuclease V [Vibrio alginolyticus]
MNMIAVLDVHYSDNGSARAAAVILEDLNDIEPKEVLYSEVDSVADYEPGSFYERELPVLFKLFREHNIHPDTIVIDGLVHLPDRSDALGMHLYNNLKSIYPTEKYKHLKILGIAKNGFHGFDSYYKAYRHSIKPLIVTTTDFDIGISEAVSLVKSLPGKYRLPEIVKLADHACRGML